MTFPAFIILADIYPAVPGHLVPALLLTPVANAIAVFVYVPRGDIRKIKIYIVVTAIVQAFIIDIPAVLTDIFRSCSKIIESVVTV